MAAPPTRRARTPFCAAHSSGCAAAHQSGWPHQERSDSAMTSPHTSADHLLRALQEREKELNCFYTVQEILRTAETVAEAFPQIVAALPSGWQYPDICQAQLTYHDQTYQSPQFVRTAWA